MPSGQSPDGPPWGGGYGPTGPSPFSRQDMPMKEWNMKQQDVQPPMGYQPGVWNAARDQSAQRQQPLGPQLPSQQGWQQPSSGWQGQPGPMTGPPSDLSARGSGPQPMQGMGQLLSNNGSHAMQDMRGNMQNTPNMQNMQNMRSARDNYNGFSPRGMGQDVQQPLPNQIGAFVHDPRMSNMPSGPTPSGNEMRGNQMQNVSSASGPLLSDMRGGSLQGMQSSDFRNGPMQNHQPSQGHDFRNGPMQHQQPPHSQDFRNGPMQQHQPPVPPRGQDFRNGPMQQQQPAHGQDFRNGPMQQQQPPHGQDFRNGPMQQQQPPHGQDFRSMPMQYQPPHGQDFRSMPMQNQPQMAGAPDMRGGPPNMQQQPHVSGHLVEDLRNAAMRSPMNPGPLGQQMRNAGDQMQGPPPSHMFNSQSPGSASRQPPRGEGSLPNNQNSPMQNFQNMLSAMGVSPNNRQPDEMPKHNLQNEVQVQNPPMGGGPLHQNFQGGPPNFQNGPSSFQSNQLPPPHNFQGAPQNFHNRQQLQHMQDVPQLPNHQAYSSTQNQPMQGMPQFQGGMDVPFMQNEGAGTRSMMTDMPPVQSYGSMQGASDSTMHQNGSMPGGTFIALPFGAAPPEGAIQIALPIGATPPEGAIPIGMAPAGNGEDSMMPMVQMQMNDIQPDDGSYSVASSTTASSAESSLQAELKKTLPKKAFKIKDPRTGLEVLPSSGEETGSASRRLRIVNPKTGEEVGPSL